MTATVTKTFVRPNANILWHTEVLPWSLISPRYAQDVAEGRLISETVTYPNSLTRVLVQVWDTVESFDSTCADPDIIQYVELRDAYNAEYGITFDRVIS